VSRFRRGAMAVSVGVDATVFSFDSAGYAETGISACSCVSPAFPDTVT
jgi:hypothetical protein